MKSPQAIEKQKGNQVLAHNNTVFPRRFELMSRKGFESQEKQHHAGRPFRTASR